MLARYDDLLSCSPYHVYSKFLDFTDILALEIMYILIPKFPQIQSQSIYFPGGGHAPRPPSISMLYMLIVLHTIIHTITYYTKDHTLCP